MKGNQMRLQFLQETYIPYIQGDMYNFKHLSHVAVLNKCEEYGVIVENKVGGTEVLKQRLYNTAFQMKREAHREIADLVLEIED